MTVLWLKQAHMTLAGLSVTLFLMRYIALRELKLKTPSHWGVRAAPHIIDTALLASGVSLALLWRLSPLAAGWFGLKLCLIVVYILLGFTAMKHGQTYAGRRWACIAALLTAATVAALALFKPF